MACRETVEAEVEEIYSGQDEVFNLDNTCVDEYTIARSQGTSRERLQGIAEEVDTMLVDDSFSLEYYWRERRLGRDGDDPILSEPDGEIRAVW